MPDDKIHKPAKRAERIGKYEILGHIATGGMGVIYKARDVELDRTVALKILPPDMATQSVTLERFKREARAAAQMRHENIVTTFDVGEANGTHFIALEFIDGADLQDYINRKCRLDPEDVRQIMVQATRALAHAHESKIVHRDIKPSNFLLMHKDERLIVKLTDFGLAMRHQNDAEFRITRDKTTVGTVDYMSPEQARDSRSADIRSDIYSLGCTAYHMLAGNAPFAKGTLPERIVQHMQAPPPDVRKLNKSVPEYLAAIIEKMLAKKPDDRYQSPAELLDALESPENFLAPDPRGPAPAKIERTRPKPKSDPTSVIANIENEETSAELKVAKPARPKRTVSTPKAPERDEEPAARALESAVAEPSEPAGKKGRGKKPAAPAPPWIYMAAASVGVLLAIVVLMLAFGGRTSPKKDAEKKTPPPPIAAFPDDPIPPPAVVDTAAAKMTVPAPVLPIMDFAPDKVDRKALRKEYHGEFMAFPTEPANAPILRVSRAADPGPGNFRTLEAALAQTKLSDFTVIEIGDDGPFFVSRLPALAKNWILIRAAAGHRPLLVWELPKKSLDPKAPPVFASLTRGRLVLENVDFVARLASDAPAVVFDLPGSDFYARNCTFSLVGKPDQPISLLRRSEDGASDVKPQIWLQRCYVRGPELTLLQLQAASGQIMIEDSLIAGYQQPLLRFRGRDADNIELRCVRSTLVSGQTFLRWQSLTGQAGSGGRPNIQAWLLDSIVSRDDTRAAKGELVELADGAEPSKMHWWAANSAYAGWKQLLASRDLSITGGALAPWHVQWGRSLGDRALAEAWPSTPPGALEEQAASAFLPKQTPVAFAALTGPGAIGCVIGWLPTAPANWQERLFEQRRVPPIDAADFTPPRIENADDGLYHGERLDLTKIDLGAHVNGVLQKGKVAPRVVLHLFGRGGCPSSPLRIKGLQDLVLYFEHPFPPDPLILEVNPTVLKPPPLIDMTGGRLELINARFRLNPGTLVPALISMQDGDLTITRSWLQGPLGKSDAFENLIVMGNSAPTPTTLLLRDNVLLSGKTIAELRDNVQLHARNNLFFSLGDGIVMDANAPTATMTHVIDHNTFAAQQQTFVLRTGPSFEAAGRTLLHANSNVFWSPFAGSAERRALMLATEPWLGRGRFTWQGSYNVYDTRLPRYLISTPTQTDAQGLTDWQQTWGAAGEQEAIPHEPAGAMAKLIALDGVAPALIVSQLDRLALPAKLRGDPTQAPPGANLLLLGIQKKK